MTSPNDTAPAEPAADERSGFALDEVAAAAIELARAAAIEVGGDEVGERLGVAPEAERVVTHSFAATRPGYRGWHWAVTVTRASGATMATVDEVVLLPGAGALLAPPWLPWAQRVLPGDLGVGDLLPADPDDIRLVPSYADDDSDAQVPEVAFELGLGRARVLSFEGRTDAAERWLVGDGGPDSPVARQAPAHCGTCGFMVSIGGSLRAAFGVCANEYSSVDGRVVSVEFGCGAHSEAPVALSLSAPSGVVYDDGGIVLIDDELIDEAIIADTDLIDDVSSDFAAFDELAFDETDLVTGFEESALEQPGTDQPTA